jgi:hypothetical protein
MERKKTTESREILLVLALFQYLSKVLAQFLITSLLMPNRSDTLALI